MSAGLQQIVDTLGAQLQRSVAVDDPALRLLAYSPHYGTVDAVRYESIMHRGVSGDVVRWARTQGIATATGPVRLAANEQFDMKARVCVPIRCRNVLLGYLFLIDEDQTLTEADLAHTVAAAEAAGIVLYHERLLAEVEHGRERELLRDLLSDDTDIAAVAADELVEGGLAAAAGPAAVLAARVLGPSEAGEALRTALASALDEVWRGLSPRHSLRLTRTDHAVLVAFVKDPVLRTDGVAGLAAQLHLAVAKAVDDLRPERVLVGSGAPVERLADAARSYRQARTAIDIAAIIPTLGDVVAWDALGVYRTLARVAREDIEDPHPGLRRLMEGDAGGTLVETLETYLDLAGDAKATAARLCIHRTSLYYRLGRIEQLAGVDLSDGNDRLALHLGLKLAQLAGLRG